MRSSARKSGSASPVSASTTAASETPGKWWPFATICVPTRTARSAAAKRSSASRSAPGFAAVSASSRIRSSSGTRFASSDSSCCVPAPIRASSDGAARPGTLPARPPSSRSGGSGAGASPCSVSATSQRPQRRETPQARQWIAGASAAAVEQQDRLAAVLGDPAELREQRRRERIAGLAAQVDDPHASASARRAARRARAARAAPSSPAAASRSRRRRRRPRARPASPRRCARRSGGRTPACRTSRAPRRCRSGRGSAPARRRPSGRRRRRAPRRATIRSRSSRRSASVSPECSTAMRSPKRAWKRPSVCGVSAISGTSTIAPVAALERGGAGLEVDLRLAAAGRAGEQQVRAAAVDRLDDPRDRRAAAASCSCAGSASPAMPCAGRPPLAAPRAQLRRDELERAGGRRAVVVGEPERELDERRRQLVEDALDRRRPRRPRGASTPVSTTTPRAAERPKRIETTAPLPTSSGTSYVNGRATAREETSG